MRAKANGNTLKTLRWTLYSTGVLLVLLGLCALRYPEEELLSFSPFLGTGLILCGVNELFPCFTLRGDPLWPRWLFFLGGLDLAFGGVMLLKLGLTSLMVPLFMALWFFLTALVRLFTSFRLRAFGLSGWRKTLANGFLTALCSALLCASPFAAELSSSLVLASSLAASGLLVIFEGRSVFIWLFPGCSPAEGFLTLKPDRERFAVFLKKPHDGMS